MLTQSSVLQYFAVLYAIANVDLTNIHLSAGGWKWKCGGAGTDESPSGYEAAGGGMWLCEQEAGGGGQGDTKRASTQGCLLTLLLVV